MPAALRPLGGHGSRLRQHRLGPGLHRPLLGIGRGIGCGRCGASSAAAGAADWSIASLMLRSCAC